MSATRPPAPTGVTPPTPVGAPLDRHGAHEVSRWIESLFLATREP